jgi:guanosine-3',5'-bis(diphosphate) 3'-pyrophosphohydrolase
MWNPDVYGDALRFAATRHGAQTVPGSGHPYVVHLTTVAAEVLAALARERFAQPDLAVQCALLHDTVEDTATTRDEIVAHFGEAVADGVTALSKDDTLPKEAQMADSLRRIHTQPMEVWIVKLADRITNLQPPPHHWTLEKRRGYHAQAGEILAALAPASLYLADRLAAKMSEYERWLIAEA